MVFSFFLKYLSDQFGLKGTLLLAGGVYMQILPAAFLWRRSENETLGHMPKEGTIYCTNTTKVAHQNDIDVDSLLSKSGNTYMTHKNEFSIHVDNDNGGNAVLHLTNADNSNKINSKLIAETNISVSLTRPYDMRLIGRKHIGITLKSKNIRRESIGKYLKDLALNPSFVLFAIGLAIVYPALGILFIFIVDLFLDSGLSEDDATFGLLLVHMFSIFGRLLPGIVMQSKHIPSLSVPICAAVVMSACMTGLVTVTGLRLHLLMLGLIGIPYGVFVSVFNVTTLKIVGIDGLSSAVGVHFTLNGIGSALAGPISGSLRDKTGSYTYPFGIASGVILVGAMFFTCSLLIRRKSNRVPHVSERTPLLQDAH
ncbi:monocarboxylate transporter 12-like isoform X2 [Ruditapes philippinarum]|nr:monocarboxylate transporter 12-like isoform X2 [Ruditapes philippinarum]XP_060567846.1 monocarboxylate transporter 12-like isoform X2 [Ruditapes philippinarum]